MKEVKISSNYEAKYFVKVDFAAND